MSEMVKEIPLQNGMVALVDDEDFESVNQFNWYVTGITETNFNVETTMRIDDKRKSVSLQRYVSVDLKDKEIIIFKDKNPLNCQKNNLIVANIRAKSLSKRGVRNSSSKYKGVSWFKNLNKWVAKIRVNGKDKHLGYFVDEDKAAEAYNEAAKIYFGELGYLNVIGEDNSAISITTKQNIRVSRKPKKQTTSSYKGVHWRTERSKWIATIIKDKKSYWLGQFDSEEQAAKAYDKKAYELHGDKATLNFPELIEEYKNSLSAATETSN